MMSSHGAPRKKARRSPKRLLSAVCGVLVATVAVGCGAAATGHSKQGGEPGNPDRSRISQNIAPPASWNLTFSSSFAGTQLDTKTWATCFPWALPQAGGCANYGNSGQNKEWYLPSQVQVSGGVLHLVAQAEPTAGLTQQGTAKEYACRSGMVTTFPSFQFEYGYVQVIAKIPFGKGLWPALWLAAANEQWPPEIDLLEHWGTDDYGKVYLHPAAGPRQGGPKSMPGLANGWHTFTLSWTQSRLTWYYDDTQVFSTTTGIPQQPMYLLANLADFDTSPGGCSGQFLIKSVKVWQP